MSLVAFGTVPKVLYTVYPHELATTRHEPFPHGLAFRLRQASEFDGRKHGDSPEAIVPRDARAIFLIAKGMSIIADTVTSEEPCRP